MTRRALLVGAQTGGLEGPDGDVGAMTEGLGRHGFTDIRECVGADATRDGIVTAYERLIADTEPGDVALVYYSGHGSYVWPGAGEPDEVAAYDRQFIVPTDYEDRAGVEFRGITAVELSVLQRRLTGRTGNVVVVLDCCHSALMSRTLGTQVPKQRTRVTALDLAEHLRRRFGGRLPAVSELGSSSAVRIVACGTRQVAYEQRRHDGAGYYGLLTAAFLRALDESADTPVSWSRLMERIRHLVQADAPHQRPEVEGPAQRRLFTDEDDDASGSLPVVHEGDDVRLPGAMLLGVQVGDRFAIMPGGVGRAALDRRLGTVEITGCDRQGASGPLQATVRGARLPLDARAFRTRAMAPQVAVDVPGQLRDLVAAGTFARPAGAGEEAPFQVVEEGGGLTLRDRFGPLLRGAAVPAVIAGIERAARATVLREVREAGEWPSGPPVTIEWGRIVHKERRPLPPRNAELVHGDSVYIEVHNRSGGEVWVSLLDVGVSYAITHITKRAPSGDRFAEGGSYVFGLQRRTGELTGRRLEWPQELEPVAGRPETVLVFVTDEPYDLTSLVQPPVRGAARGSGAAAGLLSHFLTATDRDFEESEPFLYVDSVEFTLRPSAEEAR